MRVLVVSHFFPIPPRAGNEIRLFRLILWLKSQGHSVTLLVRPQVRLEDRALVESRHRDLVDRLEIFVDAEASCKPLRIKETSSPDVARSEDGFCPPLMLGRISEILKTEDVGMILVQYVFMSRALLVPTRKKIIKVIDTHDIFSLKDRQVYTFGVNDNISLSRASEGHLLNRADLILGIQSKEKQYLMDLVPGKEVITVPIDFDFPLLSRGEESDATPTLFFAASSNPLNAKGLNDFLAFAWPEILTAVPNTRLRVAGDVKNRLDASLQARQVELLGRVEDLAREYREASVVINPVVAGTGLKIKSVEALCHGKPLVSWPNGVEGVNEEGQPFLIAHDWFEFARHVIRLLREPVVRKQVGDQGRRVAESQFSTDNAYAALLGAMTSK